MQVPQEIFDIPNQVAKLADLNVGGLLVVLVLFLILWAAWLLSVQSRIR